MPTNKQLAVIIVAALAGMWLAGRAFRTVIV